MTVQEFIALISGITGCITAIGVLIVNKTLIDQKLDHIEEKLNEHNKKLDEHNGYASRFSEIEKAIVAIQKDIGYLREMEEAR